MIMENLVPRRIANIIINALKGGVVPRVGLEYITVGRAREINAFVHDIDIIAEGGATFRFIVGKYGSGKSFLLQTVRNYATAKGFNDNDSPECASSCSGTINFSCVFIASCRICLRLLMFTVTILRVKIL